MTATPSSLFADPSLQLLCVIGSRDGDDRDAQIAVSVVNASIVPEQPRLLIILWHGNHTRDLVAASRTLTLSVLSERNLAIVAPLGLPSASSESKSLDGLGLGETADGLPYVGDSVGYAECRVLATLDLGDATVFAVAPEHETPLTEDAPITWRRAAELLGDDFQRQYQPKLEDDRREASQTMLWL